MWRHTTPEMSTVPISVRSSNAAMASSMNGLGYLVQNAFVNGSWTHAGSANISPAFSGTAINKNERTGKHQCGRRMNRIPNVCWCLGTSLRAFTSVYTSCSFLKHSLSTSSAMETIGCRVFDG